MIFMIARAIVSVDALIINYMYNAVSPHEHFKLFILEIQRVSFVGIESMLHVKLYFPSSSIPL